jgi:hypothetical protein
MIITLGRWKRTFAISAMILAGAALFGMGATSPLAINYVIFSGLTTGKILGIASFIVAFMIWKHHLN